MMTYFEQKWQKRRVVCTKSKMYITLLNEDMVRDSIPLAEVTKIEIMRQSSTASIQPKSLSAGLGESSTLMRSQEPEQPKFIATICNGFSFQILTAQSGVNSGRSYYFQVDSNEQCETAVQEIRTLVDEAKIQAEETSRFIRSRNFARDVFNSLPFQFFSAFLIIVVRQCSRNLLDFCKYSIEFRRALNPGIRAPLTSRPTSGGRTSR